MTQGEIKGPFVDHLKSDMEGDLIYDGNKEPILNVFRGKEVKRELCRRLNAYDKMKQFIKDEIEGGNLNAKKLESL